MQRTEEWRQTALRSNFLQWGSIVFMEVWKPAHGNLTQERQDRVTELVNTNLGYVIQKTKNFNSINMHIRHVWLSDINKTRSSRYI